MRIPCPFCGERSSHEFAYLGDATTTRPNPVGTDAEANFFAYAYIRENPAGPHLEWWYHGSGCRQWVKVARDTRTHAISGATLARPQP